MGVGYVGKPRLLDLPAVSWFLDVVDVMDVSGAVELWHEEGVSVPELVLYERSVELLESKGCKLVLDPLDVVSVWIVSAWNEP